MALVALVLVLAALGSGTSGAAMTGSAAIPPARIRHELDAAEWLLRKRLGALTEDGQVAVLRDSTQLTLRVPAGTLFEADSAELKPDSLRQLPLSAVVDLLLRRYRLVGQISVYSDSIGGSIANHGMTEQRALALLTALHTTRVRATRLTAAGLGAESEIGSDETPEGREQNRRVEVVFALAGTQGKF